MFAFLSLLLLVGTCAAWLLSTRRFPPYAACTLYDQRNVPYRWLKAMGLPSGLILRIDQVRRNDKPVAAAADHFNGLTWKASPGEGRVFDQPAEWVTPQLRTLDQSYRDLLTRRLLLPWWLLVLLLIAAPARWTYVRLRRSSRADQGRCPECGQDLRVAVDATCPKCGAVPGEIAA